MNSSYYLKEKNLSIQIENKIIEEMLLCARKHYPNEFGGLLIGFYANGNKDLIITNFLTPKSFKASPVDFERETKDLQEALKAFYHSYPSKYYVGEWHSHPGGGTAPSNKDIKAMKQISECEGVSINKPVLCIIGYTKQEFQIQFHLITKNKIYTYEQQDSNFRTI